MTRVRVSKPSGRPEAVLGRSGWVEVEETLAHWLVEVGWWRTPPASPRRIEFWRVLLVDGRCLDLRHEPRQGWGERVWG